MFTVNPSQINFYDENDHNQFISQLSPPTAPSSTDAIINTNKIVQEQFRQSQECLETSAAYMKEIDSFFRELSMQRPAAILSYSASNVTSSLSFDSFDFDLTKTINDDNLNAGVIDPAIIFNIDHISQIQVQNEIDGIISDYGDDEDYDDIFEDENQSNTIHRQSSRFSNQDSSDNFGIIRFQRKQPTKSKSLQTRPRKNLKLNSSTFSSSTDSFNGSSFSSPKSNSTPKIPKFYSRSGQIADPNRGPCHNCNTTLTCYWRKLDGLYYCNACTLFYKRNNMHRDVKEIAVDKPIKRRNRKSKYAEM